MNRPLKFLLGIPAAALLAAGFVFAAFPPPGTVPILMYHFIGSREQAAESGNYVERGVFRRQMEFLKRFGYRVISLDDYYRSRTGARRPRGREIMITFDDGHVSFEKEALPILESFRFPVTLFIISGNLQKNDPASMPLETLKKLKEKPWISLQSHTRTHVALSLLTEAKIRGELQGSKKDLETAFGGRIDYLAYPIGDLDARVLKIAESAGYRLAFTTSYKRLKGIPEGPACITRVKINRVADNPIVFWYEVSGLHQRIKGTLYKLKYSFPRPA